MIKGVSLSVARGEVVCIIGPSGSGKSTLLRCLNWLEVPERGEIRIDGEPAYRELATARVSPAPQRSPASAPRPGWSFRLQPFPAHDRAGKRVRGTLTS